MKRIIYIASIVLMLCSLYSLNAQTNSPVDQKNSVLIADKKPVVKGTAFESLVNGYGTISTAIDDLSDKQERRIIRLEACRDKRLTKLDSKINSKSQFLKTEARNLSEKQKKKVERSILNLLLDRQQLTSKYKRKILQQLSPAQKEKAGWSNF